MITRTSAPQVAEQEPVAAGPSRRERLTSFMPLIALVGILAAISVANPRFLSLGSLTAVVDAAGPLAVLAAGATVVVLCGGIDLSIAALASLSSVLLALWLPVLGGPAWPAVVLTAAVAGGLQGAAHVFLRIPSFIVTLGGLAIFSSVALVLSNASTISADPYEPIGWAFTRVGGVLPSTTLVAVAVAVAVTLVLKLTPVGSWVSAIGYSEPAARLAGNPVDLVKIGAFTLSGACAGLAAVLQVARTFSGTPTLMDSLLLPAVAAIVVGGTAITGGHGAPWRTLVGALVVTLLSLGLSTSGIGSGVNFVLYGGLVVVAVALTLDRSKVLTVK